MSFEDYLRGYRMASNTWAEEYGQLKSVPREVQASKGFCYIVHLESNLIKIGFVHTKARLVERWKELSLENLYKVHPVATIEGGFFKEQFLHSQFNKFRIQESGETFWLDSGLKRYIDMLAFNRLTLDIVEEWYGPSYWEYRPVFKIANTSQNLKTMQLRGHAWIKPHVKTIVEDDITILANLEVSNVFRELQRALGSEPKWQVDFRDSPRSVWSMEF